MLLGLHLVNCRRIVSTLSRILTPAPEAPILIPMNRLASMCLSVILLWTLAPGIGELVENGVHLVTQHHLAHDAPEGDEHETPDREHGCTGTVHLCSCHVSQTFLAISFFDGTMHAPPRSIVMRAQIPSVRAIDGGIDHPPRA